LQPPPYKYKKCTNIVEFNLSSQSQSQRDKKFDNDKTETNKNNLSKKSCKNNNLIKSSDYEKNEKKDNKINKDVNVEWK